MPKRTPPSKQWPAWTESRFNQFIRSALRMAFNKYPPKYEALKEARRPHTGDDKRRKWDFQCNKCKDWFKSTEVQVDHIEPCGTSLEGWDVFVDKMFCGVDGLQVLCKPCHKGVTAEQKAKRKDNGN